MLCNDEQFDLIHRGPRGYTGVVISTGDTTLAYPKSSLRGPTIKEYLVLPHCP